MTEETATATLPPAPPRFVGERPRYELVSLDWPIEYDGTVYHVVKISRMTVADVQTFLADMVALEAKDPKASAAMRFPIFDVPAPVIDSLDDDDSLRVQEVAQRFLPLRFRDPAGSEPAPSNGAPSLSA